MHGAQSRVKQLLHSVCLSCLRIFFFFNINCRGSQDHEHTECTTRGAGDKRGGRGKDKPVGNRDMRRSVEGRWMGWRTRDIQDGHHRDFQDLTRRELSGRKAGNLKEVGLGWINGGRKDHGFGWWKIRDGGEQLF